MTLRITGNIGSRSSHAIGSWIIIVKYKLSKSKLAAKSVGLYTNVDCVHSGFDLGNMTLIQGHDKPSTQRQQLLGVLSRSKLVVKSAGPTQNLTVCTVTLTLEI